MKRELKLTYILALLISLVSLSNCTTTREREVEDDLSDFRTWVNRETSQLANRTEEDWKQAKQDFQTRTQELDQKQEQFSDEVQQEYQQLKDEFNKADETYTNSQSAARMSEWERKLLGRWADMATINEANVREAYITFMENVRAQKSNWSDADWEMAKLVLEELDERKNEITADIDTDTEVKIKALQMEFRTIKTAGSVDVF